MLTLNISVYYWLQWTGVCFYVKFVHNFEKILAHRTCSESIRKATERSFTKPLTLFSVWCSLKGHIFLDKPAAETCRFIYVNMTFSWTPGTKRLTTFPSIHNHNFSITIFLLTLNRFYQPYVFIAKLFILSLVDNWNRWVYIRNLAEYVQITMWLSQ